MCSLVDGALDDELTETESIASNSTTSSTSKLCQKCRVAEPILKLRKKDVYCKACFLTACHHKFRSTLGKNKAVQIDDRILVAFGGGSGSLALLKLIRSSFEDEVNLKKVKYTPIVIVIDESSAGGVGETFPLEKALKTASAFDFLVFVTDLAGAVDDSYNGLFTPDKYKRNIKGSELLQTVINDSGDTTSREILIKELRRRVLLASAEVLNCRKIFTGESATSLAITLMTGVAVGRGGQIRNESGFQDDRHDSIPVIRPLREFSVEEVSFFHEHCGTETPVEQEKNSKKGGTIRDVTEGFLLGLQAGFPSTVPTIFRTGDKLFKADKGHHDPTCVLCQIKIEKEQANDTNSGCSAVEAVRFSKLVSEKGAQGLPDSDLNISGLEKLGLHDRDREAENCLESKDDNNVSSCEGSGSCSEGGSCSSSSVSRSQSIKKDEVLCYSCHSIFQKSETLPDFLQRGASSAIRREQMREEIQDFLL